MRKSEALVVALATLSAIVVSSAADAAATVYIPLGSANSILVVDSANDRIVGRIEGVEAVHGLAATPDGRYLITGSYSERQADGAMPERPQSVSEEEHAAHHAVRKAVAAAPAAVVSTVSIIRTADRTVVRRIDVPGAVHHVAVSPDGAVAVLTHPNQNRVSVVDLVRFALAAEVNSGALPNFATFSPDGRKAYVSNAGDREVSEIDVRSWMVRRRFDVGSSPEHIVVSADGRTLYVNNVDDGTVSVVDLGAGNVTKTYAVGDVPHGIDISADGRELLVSVLGENKIAAIELATGRIRSTPLSPAPYHLARIGLSGKIYVSSADAPKLWVVDEDSLRIVDEIAIGGKGHQIVHIGGS